MSSDASAANAPREIETDRAPSGPSSRSPAPLRRSNHLFAAAALLVGVVIVAGLIAVLWESAQLNRPNAPAAHGSQASQSIVQSDSNPAQAAQAMARLLALRTLGAEAREALGNYEKESKAWEKTVSQIVEGPAGRKVAASDERVDRVAIILDKDRLTETQLKSLMQQLDTLLLPVDEAFRAGNVGFLADASYAVDVERIRDELKRAAVGFQADRELLEVVIKDSAEGTPSGAALSDRLKERRLIRASERLAAIERAAKAAHEDAIRVVGEAEAEAIGKKAAAEAEAKRLLGATEAKRLIEEAELRRKTLDDELARRKLAEEAAILRKRAEDPAVQRRYSALLDKGFRRFNSHPKAAYLDKSIEAEPASWSELNSNGWLADVKSFARALCPQPLAGYQDVPNDRRTRPYPSTDAEWKQMEPMLQEFKQLGPLWREMGLLGP
jgi:hypothetical protein